MSLVCLLGLLPVPVTARVQQAQHHPAHLNRVTSLESLFSPDVFHVYYHFSCYCLIYAQYHSCSVACARCRQ